MAGKGNAQKVLDLLDEMLPVVPWRQYFEGFSFPYGFFDPQEYTVFLQDVGLKPLRVESFPKDMKLAGAEGLAVWVRTTWLPFTENCLKTLKHNLLMKLLRAIFRSILLTRKAMFMLV